MFSLRFWHLARAVQKTHPPTLGNRVQKFLGGRAAPAPSRDWTLTCAAISLLPPLRPSLDRRCRGLGGRTVWAWLTWWGAVRPLLCLPPRPAQVLAKFGGKGSGMGKPIPGSTSPFLVLHNPQHRVSYLQPSWLPKAHLSGAPLGGEPPLSLLGRLISQKAPGPPLLLPPWNNAGGGGMAVLSESWNCARALPASLGPKARLLP